MNHFDITSIPPRSAPLNPIDIRIAAQVRIANAVREQTLRDLARPYLDFGYLPSELTAVERETETLPPERLLERAWVCVKVKHKRPRPLLWWRRTMRRIGLQRQPYTSGDTWRP